MLSFFESQPPVEPNHYRHQDEDEARTVAGLVASHSELTERGLKHLVQLLGRSQASRTTKTQEAVTGRLDQAKPFLQQLAEGGNTWAREMLDTEKPEEVSAAHVEEARARLELPIVHTSGVFTVGAGSRSLPDSTLVRTLAARNQQAALKQLLERGSSPYVSAPDRGSYLLAASNLLPPPDKRKRAQLFETALALVDSPSESVADAADEPYRHPLGAVRMSAPRDSRGEAAHLAAALARTNHDKRRVRTAALALVGDETVSEYWATRALQRLGDTVAPDVGFLSGQNWALKLLQRSCGRRRLNLSLSDTAWLPIPTCGSAGRSRYI